MQLDWWRASYQNITTNTTYSGGVVRQHGNFSFSRVYESGHEVPWYQPETAYRIFMRAMFDTDIATGTTAISSNYSTVGLASSFGIKDVLPVPHPIICYTYDSVSTCTDEQLEWLAAGTAIVEDFVLVGNTNGTGRGNATASSASRLRF